MWLWGRVFPWAIFNPRLNLKRFQRSLQTIVSVVSKQILPLPPFVSPHAALIIPFILAQPEFGGLLVISALRNVLGLSPAPKQGSHPESSRGRPGSPSFKVCVCIPRSRRDRQTDPGCSCQERKSLSIIPPLCVDSCCLLRPQGWMQRGVFPAVSPHSHVCQRPLAQSFPSPYINKGRGSIPANSRLEDMSVRAVRAVAAMIHVKFMPCWTSRPVFQNISVAYTRFSPTLCRGEFWDATVV